MLSAADVPEVGRHRRGIRTHRRRSCGGASPAASPGAKHEREPARNAMVLTFCPLRGLNLNASRESRRDGLRALWGNRTTRWIHASAGRSPVRRHDLGTLLDVDLRRVSSSLRLPCPVSGCHLRKHAGMPRLHDGREGIHSTSAHRFHGDREGCSTSVGREVHTQRGTHENFIDVPFPGPPSWERPDGQHARFPHLRQPVQPVRPHPPLTDDRPDERSVSPREIG